MLIPLRICRHNISLFQWLQFSHIILPTVAMLVLLLPVLWLSRIVNCQLVTLYRNALNTGEFASVVTMLLNLYRLLRHHHRPQNSLCQSDVSDETGWLYIYVCVCVCVCIYIKCGFSACSNDTDLVCIICRVTDPSKGFALCSIWMLFLIEIAPINIPYSQDDDFTALNRKDEAAWLKDEQWPHEVNDSP